VSAWFAVRSSSKGDGLTHDELLDRGAREARTNVEGVRLQKGRALKAGEDRTLEGRARMSLVSIAEVDRRRRTQRSTRFSTSPDLGSERGRGSSPRPASERQKRGAAAVAQRDAEGRLEAETHHVTATRDR